VRAGEDYIRHIDGLRALAVLAVIVFHLDPAWLPGGFLGVDIFFVISGFLITSIIVREHSERRFTFGKFYLRRARRILPALLATIAITLALGAFLFSPQRFESLAGSAAAAALSVSNVHFWMLAGYFDSSAIEKPLLHTWSLGVEEQFYLIWPAFILLFARSRAALIAAIALVLVSSLAASFLLNGSLGASGTFYLMPFRMFELAAGAACIWLRPLQPSRWLALALTALGFALAFCAFAFFNGHTPPWLAGAVASAASVLLLCFADRASMLARILDNPASTYVGRISYSLYLVHWPVVVFAAYLKFAPLSVLDLLGCAALMLLGALGLYYFVERPSHYRLFRNNWRPLVAIVACGSAFLVALSAWAWTDGGWPWRYSTQTQQLFNYARVPPPPGCALELGRGPSAFDRTACITPREGAINVLLIGDSLTDHLKPTLETLLPNLNIMQASAAGCLPLRNYRRQPSRACERFNRLIYDEVIPSGAARYVLLTGKWEPQSLASLHASLNLIREAGAIPILVSSPPIYTQEAPEIAFRGRNLPPQEFQRFVNRSVSPRAARTNERLRALAAELDVPFIDIRQSACPAPGQCRVLTREGALLAVDRTHPTREGSLELLGDARARGELAVLESH
jgi:peptidoglycan/LPS O-acetylase OafA/YrhL